MNNSKEFGLIFKAISHLLHNQKMLMDKICEDKFYSINDTEDLSIMYSNLSDNYYMTRKEECLSQTISCLDKLKKANPNQEIIVETPKGTVSLKIGDALIYEDNCGKIVIDSE